MTQTVEAETAGADELSALARELLDFERGWWRMGQDKGISLQQRFSMSVADYHRALNSVIDQAGAVTYDRLLVRRLRRQRDRRREERGARLK